MGAGAATALRMRLFRGLVAVAACAALIAVAACGDDTGSSSTSSEDGGACAPICDACVGDSCDVTCNADAGEILGIDSFLLLTQQ